MENNTNSAKSIISNMSNRVKGLMKNLKFSNKDMLFYFLVFIVIILITMISSYFTSINNRKKNNNSIMDSFYKNNNFGAKIRNTSTNDATYQHSLRDYYIMSSYNSCCGGDFYNDYVDLEPLRKVISQGARVLDFEIYDIPHSKNKRCAIAASSTNSVYQKGTFNYLDFGEVMSTIQKNAFNSSTCPNYQDPLFLHFRLKTNNTTVMNEMGTSLKSVFKNQLLGPEYGKEYDGNNLGTMKLSELKAPHNGISKPNVVILADKSNMNFEGTDFENYVNMASGSNFLQLLRDYDVKYTPNSNNMINHNKKNMAITMPDYNRSSENGNISLHFAYGCQMICMCFQEPDSNLEYYMGKFTDNGTAFILKPENMRYQVTYLTQPKAQDPKLSYKERTISKPYFQHKL